jgi:soluble lytic murein transglycosylase-like protein
MTEETKNFLKEAALTGTTLAFCAAMPFASLHVAAAIVTAPPTANHVLVAVRGPAVAVDKLAAPVRLEAVGEDPAEAELIDLALEEQGYFRVDVPLSYDLQDALHTACERYSIDYPVALGLIEVESNFQADIVNATGDCYGLCQLNVRYFPSGLQPEENINHGLAYLREQIDRYGSLEAGLQAYHDGYDTGARWYARAVLEAAEKWRWFV